MTKKELTRALESLGWSSRAVELGIAQDFKCIYCKRDLLHRIEDYDCWTEDHIDPKSGDGERDTVNNLAVACKLCNFVKRTYKPKGTTREERIADAWRHIQVGRAKKENTLAGIVQHVAAYRAGQKSTPN
jgi:hypothetical protein